MNNISQDRATFEVLSEGLCCQVVVNPPAHILAPCPSPERPPTVLMRFGIEMSERINKAIVYKPVKPGSFFW